MRRRPLPGNTVLWRAYANLQQLLEFDQRRTRGEPALDWSAFEEFDEELDEDDPVAPAASGDI